MVSLGGLSRVSLAWREGMTGWAPLGQVPEFAAAAASAPPPIPGPGVPTGLPPVRMTIPPGELAPAPTKSSAGLIALIVVAVVLGLCVITAIPVGLALPAMGKARASARQMHDSTQVRGVHQGMILWAQNNNDQYPVPSTLDAGNTTLPAGDPKDLPRHVVSILIYNGFFSPEFCISPAEASPGFAVYGAYQYSAPAGAVGGNAALWDPAFKAYPVEMKSYGPPAPGGLSYALMPPLGGRKSKWSNTFMATEASVGNRGPAYDAVGSGTAQTWTLHPDSGKSTSGNTEIGTSSVTLLIHGGRTTWEGNIAYNDNHVNFETTPAPPTAPFNFGGSIGFAPDNLFVDENDATRAKDSITGLAGNALSNSNNLLRGWNGGTFDPRTGALIDIPSDLWFD